MAMAGYTKLFNSILASTIWRADDKTRLVWITLLAMADKNGVCEGSIPGLADFARVTIADCQKALDTLMAPDQYSRSKTQGGRRIEPVDGGWRLINHAKYRAAMSQDDRREYLRVKQAEHRDRVKSTSVNSSNAASTESTHTKAKADSKADSEAKAQAGRKNKIAVAVPATDAFDAFWHAYPKKVGKDDARKAWHKKRPDLPTVLTALSQQREYLEREGGRFVPNPSTWLNQGRWQDDPPANSGLSDTARYNLASSEEAAKLIEQAYGHEEPHGRR